MAISDELNDLQTYLGNAYTKLGLKGATIPQNKNMYNLEACVDSITPYAPPVIPPDAGTLTSISVTSNPTKTVYNEGEALDLTGVIITALYSSGSTFNVTQGCTFICNDPVTPNDTEIVVNYEDKSTSIPITVHALPIPAPASTKGLWHLDTTRNINEVTGTSTMNLTNVTGKFNNGVNAQSVNTNSNIPVTINWNNNLSLNPVTNIQSQQFTIEFWAFVPSSSSSSSFSLRINSESNAGGYISLIFSSTNWSLYDDSAWLPSNNTTIHTIPVIKNTWHHIAFVNLANNSRKIYIDGQLFAETSQALSSKSYKFILIRSNSNSNDIPIDEVLFCLEAKYSGDFIPPQAPYYIQSNT